MTLASGGVYPRRPSDEEELRCVCWMASPGCAVPDRGQPVGVCFSALRAFAGFPNRKALIHYEYTGYGKTEKEARDDAWNMLPCWMEEHSGLGLDARCPVSTRSCPGPLRRTGRQGIRAADGTP